MPAFEWVHVQLHQQKGMISLSPPAICNSARALTSGKVSMTAHIVYAPEIGPDELLKTLKLLLADRFSIFHTTLQLEIVACEHSVDGCNFVDHRHKEPSSQPDQAAARQA
ncbi:hypothetical protein [Klebsiella quasipneumoniae]|uniref:hypothetical protein n=1 Tax=Klebsiella quasipneumoniae TaxID=1463165 RepID=UPI003890BF8E